MFIRRKGSKKLKRYIEEASMEPLLLSLGDESNVLPNVMERFAGCLKAEEQP